jgi:hypothetical protein
MKPIKPGQLKCYHGVFVRAMKRDETGCSNCVLNTPYTCPNIPAKHSKIEKPECLIQGIYFVKPLLDKIHHLKKPLKP